MCNFAKVPSTIIISRKTYEVDIYFTDGMWYGEYCRCQDGQSDEMIIEVSNISREAMIDLLIGEVNRLKEEVQYF